MFPLWLKIGFTLFVAVLVVVYSFKYGAANFLWFSDIALFFTVPALWLESSLLASMVAISVALVEMLWNADFLLRLTTGRRLLGMSDYMFDTSIALPVRALSLFHMSLPPFAFWMVYVFGYDRRAMIFQSAVGVIVLLLSFLFTKPSDNINWVRGFGAPQTSMPATLYLFLQSLVLVFLMYLPTHLVFAYLFI